MIEPPASTTATWLGGFGIVATVAGWVAYLASTVVSQVIDHGIHSSVYVGQAIGYVVIVTFLTFSALMYLVARQGALYRSREHVRVPRAEIDAFMANRRPTITVLVPSYAEQPDVVRSTLLSAALQEYPHKLVVLLIDDPPNPSDAVSAASLDGCRRLPEQINELLSEPGERFAAALQRYESAAMRAGGGSPEETRDLALDFGWAASWLRQLAADHPRATNSDDLVAEEVLGALAGDFEATGQALLDAVEAGALVPRERLVQLCRRLAWTFQVEVTSFERWQAR